MGNGLVMRAQAYRTSLGVVGSGLFWLVGTLSVMTAWMLIATWRHTRRRLQAQEALVAETNFRRAMENSILTGMRALDLEGRITYVNAAFCQMTGWTEAELVGQTPPYSYWPEGEYESLHANLHANDHRAGKSHGAKQVADCRCQRITNGHQNDRRSQCQYQTERPCKIAQATDASVGGKNFQL